MAIKYAVEHWRRKMPQGMGTLYWQLDDCWPVASWSSIDFPGNWKALHYMAREFYAPLLVSSVENTEKGTIELWVSNDLPVPREGTISWQVVSTDGESGSAGSTPFKIPSAKSRRMKTVDLSQDLSRFGDRRALVAVELATSGATAERAVSSNFTTFARPKHLVLKKPGVRTVVKPMQNGFFKVTLRAQKPALWVWPDLPGVSCSYSDRFFHLLDGKSKTVIIKPHTKMSLEQVEKRLIVSSLIDTYG
jgi:beta-mannosidase